MLKMRKTGVLITVLLMLGSASAAGSSILQVSDSTIGITPGKTGVITLTLTNDGTDISYNTRVVLKALDSPLTSDSLCNACLVYSTSQQVCTSYENYCYISIGDIYGFNGKEAVFKVTVPEDTQTGTYVATFDIHYGSKNITTNEVKERIITKQVVLNIESINVKPDITISSVESPEVIHPGDEFNITVELQNSGEVKAQEINLELISNQLKVKGSTSTKLIGDLNVDEKKTVTYTLLADATTTPGIYDISFKADYSDEDNSYSKTMNTGILIDGTADFNIFIQDITPDIITPNAEVSAVISIANIGIINARAVSIQINPCSDIELGNNNEDFLGDLDAGDFTTTSFDFKPIKEGEVNLLLTVKYTTPTGKKEEFNSTERIIIRYSQAAATGPGFDISWVCYLGIGIVIVYFFAKKYLIKKKKK